MTLFWLMWVGLVLGGLIASLWYQESGRVRWFRRARVAVPKQDEQAEADRRLQQPAAPARAGDDFLPPPRVATRIVPPPGRPAG
jgi:hypothetical protein